MTKKALLIFAKQPVAGEVKTRLIPFLSEEAAAEFYRCMLLDTLAKTAELKGVDRFLFYHGAAAAAYFRELVDDMQVLPQSGRDLGERMKNAFKAVFELGYDVAVVIGTDSPDLPLSYIEEAFLKLADQSVQTVFGPSHDGGYYLLGLQDLHVALFQGIAWSTGEVVRDSLAAAERCGLVAALLAPWHDVDTAEDLFRPELLESGNKADLTRRFLLGKIHVPDYFNTSNP